MEQSHLQPHRPQGALHMGVFFSPPEATKPDTFSSRHSPLPAIQSGSNESSDLPGPIHTVVGSSGMSKGPISPPISPQTKDTFVGAHADVVRDSACDPVLFPQSVDASVPLEILIPSTDDQPARALISTHDARRSASTIISSHSKARDQEGWTAPRPSTAEYENALTFKAKIVKRYNMDRQAWIARELEYLQIYPPRYPQKRVESTVRSHKRKADLDEDGDKPLKRQRARRTAERPTVPRRVAKPSPRDDLIDEFDDIAGPVKHRRAPSNPNNGKDKAKLNRPWYDIQDFCPPANSMLPGTKLRMDWKGAPFDLSQDPDRNIICDGEAELVSVLRLTCAQYMRAKRSIFEKYIEDARVGKAFNKTAAQAVCNMDVNKASRLFIAFEKVGWFDRHHFQAYL